MACFKSLLTLIYFCVLFPSFILSKAPNDTSDRVQESHANVSVSRESKFTIELGNEILNQSYDECDCGSNSISCRFDFMSRKKCICEEGYVAVTPFLKDDEECRKCDCGNNSVSCKLDERLVKTCTCNDGYASKFSFSRTEEYCERCQCDNQAIACKFDIVGRKKCTCRKGYAPYAIRKDEVCVRCDCGIDELSCAVDYNGLRKCICGGDSVVIRADPGGEKCEKCSCGPNSISCEMFYGRKSCTCSRGYVAVDKLPLSRDEECVLPDNPFPSSWRVATYVLSVLIALIFVIILMFIYRKYKRRAVVI